MSTPIHKNQAITGAFRDFFPPDDPTSSWLVRLMIIRDDIQFALKNLPLKEEDGVDEVWRTTFFLRTLSVGLMEAKNIFAYNLTAFLKTPPDDVVKKLEPLLRDGVAKLEAVKAPLATLRDTLGGHVRPKEVNNITEAEDAILRIIRNNPELGGTVHVGGETEDVSYKSLTLNAMLFAWPEVEDAETAAAKQDELAHAILTGAGAVLLSIDGILGYFFFKNGVFKPPDGTDFGIRDRHDQPVQRPARSTS